MFLQALRPPYLDLVAGIHWFYLGCRRLAGKWRPFSAKRAGDRLFRDAQRPRRWINELFVSLTFSMTWKSPSNSVPLAPPIFSLSNLKKQRTETDVSFRYVSIRFRRHRFLPDWLCLFASWNRRVTCCLSHRKFSRYLICPRISESIGWCDSKRFYYYLSKYLFWRSWKEISCFFVRSFVRTFSFLF